MKEEGVERMADVVVEGRLALERSADATDVAGSRAARAAEVLSDSLADSAARATLADSTHSVQWRTARA